MTIKSFRGLIADGSIDIIKLSTNTGSTGYKITKFQLMPNKPGQEVQESVVSIYKIPQTTASATVDFSDNTLLASGFVSNDTALKYYQMTDVIIFDKEIFNQDIYVTHDDANSATGKSVNYYIELEQIKLDLSENTVATLKDIRNISSQ